MTRVEFRAAVNASYSRWEALGQNDFRLQDKNARA